MRSLRYGSLRGGPHFDRWLFLAVAFICASGLANLTSALSAYEGHSRLGGLGELYMSQFYWVLTGMAVAGLLVVIDYRNLERFANVSFGGGLFSLALVYALGDASRGANRWLQFGSFSFQPSEFVKLGVILAVAKWIHDDNQTEPRTLWELRVPLLITAVPTAIVMAQPDLGTSLVFVSCAGAMLAMTRIRRSAIVTVAIAFPTVSVLAWTYYMKDYQKARITSFLEPEKDVTGIGWHALQSRVAIGNGGLLGEGYKQGTQNQFNLLPDQYSDFPFAVFAEDWGFVGCVVLLSVYAFICIWAVHVASQAKDRFGAALAIGCGAMFFTHTVFNVGMAIGVLPVVGIALPFFSYGGSSMVAMFMAMGMLMSVSMRR